MLANSSKDKKATKYLLVSLLALFFLPTSNSTTKVIDTTNDMLSDNLNPVVHDAEYALEELMSYYKLWYRRKYVNQHSKVSLS